MGTDSFKLCWFPAKCEQLVLVHLLFVLRCLPSRRRRKHLAELTLCATMQDWVMRVAGARCWMSTWQVGYSLIPRPAPFQLHEECGGPCIFSHVCDIKGRKDLIECRCTGSQQEALGELPHIASQCIGQLLYIPSIELVVGQTIRKTWLFRSESFCHLPITSCSHEKR